MFGLVRTFHGHTDVVGLRLRKFCEVHANSGKVQASHFLVQVFGQTVDTEFVRLCEKFDLRQRLVGEGV